MTKRDRKRVEEGELRHSKKPDIDNLAKAILDCMRGIIFLDDRQVWAMDISKLYSEHPSWKIRIEW
jgi:Holliday junction resolvase RusA-like endonuclease